MCTGPGDLTGNLKCILLSLALATGYWFAPRRNKWVLLGILYFSYLVIAWYDHIYACQRQLGPSPLMHFYKALKPADSDQMRAYNDLCPETYRIILAFDVVVLVTLVALAPAFLRWRPNASK
jgi:hypothetical protein